MPEPKEIAERIIAKQHRFWVTFTLGIMAVSFVVLLLMSFVVSYITESRMRHAQAETEKSLEDYIKKPFVVTIPMTYSFNVSMGIQTELFRKATVTCYSNRPEETDGTPDITATGAMVAEGTVAVSQDLWGHRVHPGDLVYIVRIKKYFVAQDTMNMRHKNAFDIFFFKENRGKMYDTFASDVIVMRVSK